MLGYAGIVVAAGPLPAWALLVLPGLLEQERYPAPGWCGTLGP